MNKHAYGIPLEGFAEFSRKVAAEGAVLLRNEGNVLPIRQGETVSIFGRTQINYYRSGTGSGASGGGGDATSGGSATATCATSPPT